MRIGERFQGFEGSWEGESGLRMMPGDAFDAGPSSADLRPAAGGNAVALAYDWVHGDGSAQDGLIVLSNGPEATVRAVWSDSWHQQPEWMAMTGTASAHAVSVSAPYGEDEEQGGWHIHLDLADPDRLVMTMSNEMPATGTYEVVRATWHRTEGPHPDPIPPSSAQHNNATTS